MFQLSKSGRGRFLHGSLHHGTQPLRAVVVRVDGLFCEEGGGSLYSKTPFHASSSSWQWPDSTYCQGLIGRGSGAFRMQSFMADTLPPVRKRCGGCRLAATVCMDSREAREGSAPRWPLVATRISIQIYSSLSRGKLVGGVVRVE